MNPYRLTPDKILDAFPEEADALVPKLLKRRRKQMQWLASHLLDVAQETDNITARIVSDMWINFAGKTWERDIRRLKNLSFKLRQRKGIIKVMPDSINIDQARDYPIENLYNFEQPRKVGARIHCKCPFHDEKKASFVIYLNYNTFWCFSCQRGSSAIDFIMLLNNLDFKSAVKYINDL